MSRFTWVILRDEMSGPVVVSRHATSDNAHRALTMAFREGHDGLMMKPIETGRLGSPIFQPEVGERIKLVGQFVRPLNPNPVPDDTPTKES